MANYTRRGCGDVQEGVGSAPFGFVPAIEPQAHALSFCPASILFLLAEKSRSVFPNSFLAVLA